MSNSSASATTQATASPEPRFQPGQRVLLTKLPHHVFVVRSYNQRPSGYLYAIQLENPDTQNSISQWLKPYNYFLAASESDLSLLPPIPGQVTHTVRVKVKDLLE